MAADFPAPTRRDQRFLRTPAGKSIPLAAFVPDRVRPSCLRNRTGSDRLAREASAIRKFSDTKSPARVQRIAENGINDCRWNRQVTPAP